MTRGLDPISDRLEAKVGALEAVGVRVGCTPTQVAVIAMEILGG
jgi:hypothetical protein